MAYINSLYQLPEERRQLLSTKVSGGISFHFPVNR